MNQPVPDELISAFFDGEVTPDERRQVENLLESSTEFRQLLDDTSKLSALLHSFPREAAPAGLVANVEKQVDQLSVSPAAPVFALPAAAKISRSLRREWTAFGAGMFATMASLLLYVTFHPMQVNRESVRLAISTNPSPISNSLSSEVEWADGTEHKLSEAELRNLNAGTYDKLAASDEATGDLDIHRSTPMPDVSTAVSDLSLADQQLNYVEMAVVEPADTPEFLWSLKNGDIIYRQIVDPTNAVAVVELTVVDIDKGADEIKLLLQKRNVQKAEDGETSKNADEKLSTVKFPHQIRKSTSPDEMYVFYVRAKGDQLSETLSESLKDHPDICKKLEAQLPIELPLNVANSVDATKRNSYSESDAKGRVSSRDDQQSVSVEASLAVDSYAESKGLAYVKDLDKNGNSPSSMVAENGRKEDLNEGAGSDSKSLLGRSLGVPVANQFSRRSQIAENQAKPIPESDSASQGYATRRVALESQRQPSQQQRSAKQNSTPTHYSMPGPNSNSIALNNGVFFNNGMGGNQGLGMRSRYSRSVSDTRDPRLVRLLIVLKPEVPNPATTP